jgi:site-specific DNA recombinase
MVDLAIARELSKMGLQTPGERNGSVIRTRAPGMWSDNAVRRILTTETYAGILRYGRRTGSGGKRGKRPKKDQIPIPVPAIVSRELWNAAQERREFNKRTSRRNCRRKYLVRGLIECECRYAMHGQ